MQCLCWYVFVVCVLVFDCVRFGVVFVFVFVWFGLGVYGLVRCVVMFCSVQCVLVCCRVCRCRLVCLVVGEMGCVCVGIEVLRFVLCVYVCCSGVSLWCVGFVVFVLWMCGGV